MLRAALRLPLLLVLVAVAALGACPPTTIAHEVTGPQATVVRVAVAPPTARGAAPTSGLRRCPPASVRGLYRFRRLQVFRMSCRYAQRRAARWLRTGAFPNRPEGGGWHCTSEPAVVPRGYLTICVDDPAGGEVVRSFAFNGFYLDADDRPTG